MIKREIILAIIAIITMVAIITSYFIFSVENLFDQVDIDDLQLVSLSQYPENPQEDEEITIIAEILGGNPFSGFKPNVDFESFFGYAIADPYSNMKFIGANNYSITFSGKNGTEIWYLIHYGGKVLAEDTIQIGEIQRDDLSLAISNITIIPQNPTTSTDYITITIDISTNNNIINAGYNYCIFHSSSRSSSSSSFYELEENSYSFTMPTASYSDYYGQSAYPAGSQYYYAVAFEDEFGYTAFASGNFTLG